MSAGRPPKNPQEALPELAELSAWLATALVGAGYDNVHQFLVRNKQFDKKLYGVRNGTERLDLAVNQADHVRLVPTVSGIGTEVISHILNVRLGACAVWSAQDRLNLHLGHSDVNLVQLRRGLAPGQQHCREHCTE